MNRKWIIISNIGWLAGAGIILASTGGSSLMSAGRFWEQTAHAGGDSQFSREMAVAVATDWAGPYVKETIGTQVGVDGGLVSMPGMQLVDALFFADTSQLVTSIESGVGFSERKDFWVVSWERSGVDNVTTGRANGTAYLVVTVEDGTGKVLAASAGVRQPEDQARSRGPFPSFEDLFGDLMECDARRQADKAQWSRQGELLTSTDTCD